MSAARLHQRAKKAAAKKRAAQPRKTLAKEIVEAAAGTVVKTAVKVVAKRISAPKRPAAKKIARKPAVAKTKPAPFPAGAKPHIPGGHFILLGDCLDAMAELRDERGFREQVDLIYLDPPFNSKSEYSFIFGEDNATKSSVVAFTDLWKWEAAEPAYEEYVRSGAVGARFLKAMRGALGTSEHGRSMLSYLTAMTPRLELMRELLKPSGSIYLHCDHSAGHYLKSAMDAVFGVENFRNEIIWHHPKIGVASRKFTSNTDTVLFYTKGRDFSFTPVVEDKPNEIHTRFKKLVRGGKLYYREMKGVNDSISRSKCRQAEKRLGRPLRDNDVVIDFALPENKKRVDNVWKISFLKGNSNESLGYPTQKPISLLKRIIFASSKKGDLVMDPYCGCGTTLAACVEAGRDFVGVDIEPFAAKTIQARMAGQYLMDVRVGHVQPRTENDFARLVEDKRYREFQYHAINLIHGGFPNPKHSGDKGVDGWIFVRRQGQPKNEAVIISVKAGGQLSPAMVRELAGVLSLRSPRPLAGLLITMGEPTAGMLNAAEEAGHYEDGAESIPRIQILPIRRLLEGRYQMPGIVEVKGLAGEFRGLYAGL